MTDVEPPTCSCGDPAVQQVQVSNRVEGRWEPRWAWVCDADAAEDRRELEIGRAG